MPRRNEQPTTASTLPPETSAAYHAALRRVWEIIAFDIIEANGGSSPDVDEQVEICIDRLTAHGDLPSDVASFVRTAPYGDLIREGRGAFGGGGR